MNYDRRREQEKKRQRKKLIVATVVAIIVIVPIIILLSNFFKGCSDTVQDNRESSPNATSNVQSNDGILVPVGPSDAEEDESQSSTESNGQSESSVESSSEPSSESSPEPSSEPEDITTMNKKISVYVSNEKSEVLRLVNRYNVLPSDFEPEITELKRGKTFNAIAAEQLDKMIDDCNAACGNGELWAQSTYRSYSKQEKLYREETEKWLGEGYSQSEAEEKAATIVAPPGTSEHNTGLACDFNTITESFAKTEMYDWLIEHCAEYGFVERYPKSKQDITGIIWEPWHYRYVGVEVATEIMENGWCLEEYHYYKGL